MRSFTSGAGLDTTATVKAHLASNPQPLIYTFIKIQLARWTTVPTTGFTPAFKTEWLLTDFPAAVNYAPIGDLAAANVRHGSIPFTTGMDFGAFEVFWTPSDIDIVSPVYSTLATTLTPSISAFDGVEAGFWDGAFVSVYKVVMPTPGDANTYGVTLLAMGTVDEVDIDGLEIRFSVGCPIDAQDAQIPAQLISSNSRFAATDQLMYTDLKYVEFLAQSPPHAPPFSNKNLLISYNWGDLFIIPGTGKMDGGVVVWLEGPLAGMRRPIRHNVTDVPNWTIYFHLATPFPFDQSVYANDDGRLVGYKFAAFPPTSLQSSDSFYNGFKYVPIPEDGL